MNSSQNRRNEYEDEWRTLAEPDIALHTLVIFALYHKDQFVSWVRAGRMDEATEAISDEQMVERLNMLHETIDRSLATSTAISISEMTADDLREIKRRLQTDSRMLPEESDTIDELISIIGQHDNRRRRGLFRRGQRRGDDPDAQTGMYL